MLNSKFQSLLSEIYLNIYKHTTNKFATNVPAIVTKLYREKLLSKNSSEKVVSTSLIFKLQTLLDIKSISALEVIKLNKKLTEVTEDIIERNYNMCKDQKISNVTLLKYPSILHDDDIEQKLISLKGFKKDFNNTAPLLLLSNTALKNLVHVYGFGGLEKRIEYFCDKFNITPIEAYDAMVKKPFLRKIQIKTVERNTALLNDRGITLEDIVRDFWVLRYSSKLIISRFDRAEDENVEKLKTWMVRGKEEIFNAYIKRKSENKLILGNNSLAEYLMQRLNCSFDEAASMIERFPAVTKKSMRKLREIIDFLYGEGFNAQHIIRLPKILLHSVVTSRKRLRELRSLPGGHKLDSVHILTKSQRQYMQYYETTKEKAGKLKRSAKAETKTKDGTISKANVTKLGKKAT